MAAGVTEISGSEVHFLLSSQTSATNAAVSRRLPDIIWASSLTFSGLVNNLKTLLHHNKCVVTEQRENYFVQYKQDKGEQPINTNTTQTSFF